MQAWGCPLRRLLNSFPGQVSTVMTISPPRQQVHGEYHLQVSVADSLLTILTVHPTNNSEDSLSFSLPPFPGTTTSKPRLRSLSCIYFLPPCLSIQSLDPICLVVCLSGFIFYHRYKEKTPHLCFSFSASRVTWPFFLFTSPIFLFSLVCCLGCSSRYTRTTSFSQ